MITVNEMHLPSLTVLLAERVNGVNGVVMVNEVNRVNVFLSFSGFIFSFYRFDFAVSGHLP